MAECKWKPCQSWGLNELHPVYQQISRGLGSRNNSKSWLCCTGCFSRMMIQRIVKNLQRHLWRGTCMTYATAWLNLPVWLHNYEVVFTHSLTFKLMRWFWAHYTCKPIPQTCEVETDCHVNTMITFKRSERLSQHSNIDIWHSL